MNVRERLFARQDMGYRDFQRKLLPTLPPERIIGVRTPDMRRLAKELAHTPEAEAFLRRLPHRYHEENCVHAFLLEEIRDYDACIAQVEAFLPYIDNWATCDQLSPAVFGRNKEKLLERIRVWIRSERSYTVRFAVDMLMRWYLDKDFSEEYLHLAAAVRSEEYYVRMAVAWYFATALAKQYDAALPYLQEGRLETWTHNQTIRKAIESRRISEAQKTYLRSLKRRSGKD